MRVAIIGLGAIAQKAYLPTVTARGDVDLVFCTRDRSRLHALATAYRVADAVPTVDAVMSLGVDAAFVHTSTESHVAVCETLLRAGIHVYVDKPIAYTYADAERLVDVAERASRVLMVGFNRRFAPMYRDLQARGDARLVVMQKHRTSRPDYARRFVFDDFIHVVDTLRFFVAGAIGDVRVSGFEAQGLLHHLVLHLGAGGRTALGLMNRDSGATEERLEVMSPGNTWAVRGLHTTVHHAAGDERTYRSAEWESVLHRRGFPQIVDEFLACVREGRAPRAGARDALETHALCERIVLELERSGAAPWAPAPS